MLFAYQDFNFTRSRDGQETAAVKVVKTSPHTIILETAEAAQQTIAVCHFLSLKPEARLQLEVRPEPSLKGSMTDPCFETPVPNACKRKSRTFSEIVETFLCQLKTYLSCSNPNGT